MIPERLLEPCKIAPLPERGELNGDLSELAVTKDAEQHLCNKRLDDIRAFQEEAKKKAEHDATRRDTN